jgi:hypothetical protein
MEYRWSAKCSKQALDGICFLLVRCSAQPLEFTGMKVLRKPDWDKKDPNDCTTAGEVKLPTDRRNLMPFWSFDDPIRSPGFHLSPEVRIRRLFMRSSESPPTAVWLFRFTEPLSRVPSICSFSISMINNAIQEQLEDHVRPPLLSS